MKTRLNQSVTLIELLIAIVLLSVIVLGFFSIDTFSRFHLASSDKRAQIQNEASFVLEHMSKTISQGIGDETNPSGNPSSRAVDTATIGGDTAIQVWIDYNQNGRREAEPTDRRIAYRFRDASAPPSDRYQVWYCPECTNGPCTNCSPGWGTIAENTLSKKIRTNGFTPSYNAGNNYAEVDITACADPDGTPFACGTSDNPTVNMKTRINMPAVSTR